MKTKSLSIFLVALFVVEMNLGTEEDNNENKEDENFEYKKIGDEHANEAVFVLKTILIGNSMVGKSALITKICKNTFPEGGYSATVGFEDSNLIFRIVSGENKLGPVLKYQISDCCGQEVYRNLIISVSQNFNVFLLAYDVTDDENFNNIESWVNDLQSNNTDKTIHFVLIGTKIDLKDNRKVPEETGKNFAEKNGMKFVEVSAKTGDGIKKLEYILAKIIYEEFFKKKVKDENDEEKDEEKIEVEDKSDEKSVKIKLENENENENEVDFGGGKKPTHSSSLCDCCEKICDNC